MMKPFCKIRRIERASAHNSFEDDSFGSNGIFESLPAIAQKFPTPEPAIIFSISATLHGVNALNMARAKPSGSEKVAVGCENIFGN